jgi:hypothetical protein
VTTVAQKSLFDFNTTFEEPEPVMQVPTIPTLKELLKVSMVDVKPALEASK